jgi:Major capsid protein N-terminus/Large eukaryotic DNA virus major capsid protein
MGGGLMQIVAYGSQDVYLTTDPEITFFKTVYKRHTNFAVEAIEQTFNGNATFGKKVVCSVSRNGDLINNTYLQVQLPQLSLDLLNIPDGEQGPACLSWCNSIGHALIRNVEIEIGGQKIDKHYGVWLDIWDELTQDQEKKLGFHQMIGKYPSEMGLINNASFDRIYYIPLMFWFNRSPGMSLPLIALQYHEVRINIEFRNAEELVVALRANGSRYPLNNYTTFNKQLAMSDCRLYIDYVYLDNDERQKFAKSDHEYLIEQLQFTGAESINFSQQSKSVRLNFNHPVKELIWVIQRDENCQMRGTMYNDWFNYSAAEPGTPIPSQAVDLMADAKILLNGYERFTVRPQTYFRLVQPYQHHTRIPDKLIYSYSFALRPEEQQPSGTCNMSRIDTVYLNIDLTPINMLMNLTSSSADQFKMSQASTGQISVFAVNYNVLRVRSGMAGVAFAN